MNFETFSDFISYLGAFFSGGSDYRQEWKSWRYEESFPISAIDDDSDSILEVGHDNIEALEKDIAKENAEIKERLDSTLSHAEAMGVEQQESVNDETTTEQFAEKTSSVVKNVQDDEQVGNKMYETLLENLSGVIRELDGYQSRLETEEAKSITDITSLHLIEAMENGDIEVISNDKEFNILLHTPVPSKKVENGTPIIETIRPGLKLGNKVIVRAQVKV